MPSNSLESHRELGCLDKSRVRVKLVEVPANARELGPPNLYACSLLSLMWGNWCAGDFDQHTFGWPSGPFVCPECT